MSEIPDSISGIPVIPVLEFLRTVYPWGTWFAGFDNSVQNAMPPDISELRARAFMKLLSKLDLVEGCHCGCRGDYELTTGGERYINDPQSKKPSQ